MASAQSTMGQGSAEANKQYFKYDKHNPTLFYPPPPSSSKANPSSDNADAYDARAKASNVTNIIGENILLRREWSGAEWDENTTRVLDYACGTGLTSQVG